MYSSIQTHFGCCDTQWCGHNKQMHIFSLEVGFDLVLCMLALWSSSFNLQGL